MSVVAQRLSKEFVILENKARQQIGLLLTAPKLSLTWKCLMDLPALVRIDANRLRSECIVNPQLRLIACWAPQSC